MRRRLTLALLLTASATVIWPFRAAAAADRRGRRLGFVHSGSQSNTLPAEMEFWSRLRELGWREGGDLIVVKRFAEGHYDRLPALVGEVIGQGVDLIVVRDTPTAMAARNATSSLPIVAAGIGDPLRSGLVASLARPGGNLTGLSLQFAELSAKWVELLQEVISELSTVAVISNPSNPFTVQALQAVRQVASERNLKLLPIEVRQESEYDRAFQQLRQRAQAVIVGPDALAISQRRSIAEFAAKYRVPAIYGLREFVEVGGLISYGPDLRQVWRRAAEYVDRIYAGANPSDLPIEQVSSFGLAINLKAAKALNLAIPESILLRAAEVVR